MLKIVYFFNWVCAGALMFFVLLLLLEGKKVGDAATRGLGSTLLSLCVAALAILVVLNLLPWPWTKYAGTVLVLVPLAFVMLTLAWPRWTAHQREARARAQAAQPIFADANLERLARVIEKGEPAELKSQIASSAPEAVRSQELLWFAIQEASSSSYRNEEKLQCVRALVDSGAPLERLVKGSTPVHGSASNTGNSAMLRFLFEHGVDANTRDPHFDRPYLFDAVQSSMDPLGSVLVFLKFGADPNAKAVFTQEDGPITPAIRAAQFNKWRICAALIEKGARADFKTPGGKSVSSLMDEARESVQQYGSPETQQEFARLQALVGKTPRRAGDGAPPRSGL